MAQEQKLQRLAARQHGLASRQQVLRLGFTRREIDGRLARELWARAAPRVYDVAPAHADPNRPLHAVLLACAGVASHRIAGLLHGLVDDRPPRPELLVCEGRRITSLAADVHRSHNLEGREVARIDGMACTSIPRTLLDLAHVLPEEALDDSVSRALVSRRTTLARLDRYLAAPLAGRRGATPLRTSIDGHRDRTGLTQSLLEVLVDRAVVKGKLPSPVRQLSVHVNGERFDLDLAWPEESVFVEADGRAFHSTRAQFAHDRRRQNLLVTIGWLPLRYTWHVAKHDPTRIVTQLRTVLDARRNRG